MLLELGRRRILILKTAKNEIVERCFEENKNDKIVCLIQSSVIGDFRKRYNNVEFIDIKRESFNELPEEIYEYFKRENFDKVLIPLSGKFAHNYGNVIYVVSKIRFKEAFFFYKDGITTRIPRNGVIVDAFLLFAFKILYKIL